MKSVGAQELRRVFGPDAVYIFSGKAARDEEKEQLDALHAVKSLDAFDSKMKGKVSLVKAKIKAFYTVDLIRFANIANKITSRNRLAATKINRLE